jgi:hemin uptake protein HemP
VDTSSLIDAGQQINAGSQGSKDLKKEALRIKSNELFKHGREVEIDHEGRIYRLRVTQLNKLILTA